MHTGRCGSASRQKCHTKESRKETEVQVFMYRDTMNVEHELYDYAGNNFNHWNSDKRFEEKSGNHTRKPFKRITTKDGCTWNIKHTESTAV
jgi:hypothetical protein